MRDLEMIHSDVATAARLLAQRLVEGREKRANLSSLRDAWNGAANYVMPALGRIAANPSLRNTLAGAGGGALLGLGRSLYSDPEEGESRNFAGNMLGGALGGAALGGGLTAAARAYPQLVPAFLRRYTGEMADLPPARNEITLADGTKRLLKPNLPPEVLEKLRPSESPTLLQAGSRLVGSVAPEGLVRNNPVTAALGLVDLANHSRMGGIPGLRRVLPSRITPEMSHNPEYLTKGLEANTMRLPSAIRDQLLQNPEGIRNLAQIDPNMKFAPAGMPLSVEQLGALKREGFASVHKKPWSDSGAPGLRRDFLGEYPTNSMKGHLRAALPRLPLYLGAQALDSYAMPALQRWLASPPADTLRQWSDPISPGGR